MKSSPPVQVAAWFCLAWGIGDCSHGYPWGGRGKGRSPLNGPEQSSKCPDRIQKPWSVQGMVVLWETGKGNLPLEGLKGRMGSRTEQWARIKTQCYEEIWIRGAWQVFLSVRGRGSRRGGLQRLQGQGQAGDGCEKRWHLHPLPQALAWKSLVGVGASKTWVITQSLNMHPTSLQASHLIKLCQRMLMGLAR